MVYTFDLTRLGTLRALGYLFGFLSSLQYAVLLLEIPSKLVKEFNGFGGHQFVYLNL